MRRTAPTVLHWYRVDQSRRIRRVLTVGASLLSGGALVMMASYLLHAREGIRSFTAFIGFVCAILGAVQTAVGMPRILLEEAYIAVRSDGIALRLASEETFIAWDDLEGVTFEAGVPAVVLERRGDGPIRVARSFSGITLQELAAKLADARRKAQFNLLR